MGCPVILRPQSQDDLAGIVPSIARDNPDQAPVFGSPLIDHALSIGPLPERGRIVPESNEHSVREIIQGAYRILYEFLPYGWDLLSRRCFRSSRGLRAAWMTSVMTTQSP